MALGKKMRSRYVSTLVPDDVEFADEFLHCRSTFFCRTVHSIRAFLIGLYDIPAPSSPSQTDGDFSRPLIFTRPKSEEILYPQADGRCDAIYQRRQQIGSLSHVLPYYDQLREKMSEVFGFPPDQVPWITLQEVLTCYSAHGLLGQFPGVDRSDVDKVSEVMGTIWGILYSVSAKDRNTKAPQS
jgi:hypothetical protein